MCKSDRDRRSCGAWIGAVQAAASDRTRAKLTRVRSDLSREFPHVSEERIELVLRDVTSDLGARARFQDYVPLGGPRKPGRGRLRRRLRVGATSSPRGCRRR